jgi:hypothetical protein
MKTTEIRNIIDKVLNEEVKNLSNIQQCLWLRAT